MILVLISSLRSILAIPWLSFPVFQMKIGNRSICENEFLLLFGQTGKKRKLILLHCVDCIYVCLKMSRLHITNIKRPLVFSVILKYPFPQRKHSHWIVSNVRVMVFFIIIQILVWEKWVDILSQNYQFFKQKNNLRGFNGVVDAKSWTFLGCRVLRLQVYSFHG